MKGSKGGSRFPLAHSHTSYSDMHTKATGPAAVNTRHNSDYKTSRNRGDTKGKADTGEVLVSQGQGVMMVWGDERMGQGMLFMMATWPAKLIHVMWVLKTGQTRCEE
jgi:hypothetical protein